MGQMLYAMFALSLYDRDPSAISAGDPWGACRRR